MKQRDDRRWTRRIRRLVVLACILVVVAVPAGWPVYVRPQTDELRHADAIFVLGGEGRERYWLGLDLVKHGWAPVLVISTFASDPHWLCTTEGEPYRVECVVADPSTTKGEGRELRRLAQKYNWRTVIVITWRPHISRARYILEQCFDGNLIMVASSTQLSPAEWAWQYVYQTAGYARAVVQAGC